MSRAARVLSAFVFALSVSQGDPLYSVSPLVGPPSWGDLHFYGINNSGQVAGHGWNTAGPGAVRQALIGTASGAVGIPLPDGWTLAEGWDINDAGLVAGWGGADTFRQLFIGNPSGSQAIPLPEGWSWAYEGAVVNNLGQVAGSARNAAGVTQAFVGTPAGSTAIPLPAGWTEMWATGINDAGQVVGYGRAGSGGYQAFLWNGTEVRVLDLPPGDTTMVYFDLNESGQTAGWTSSGPYLRGADGLYTPIALIPGWSSMTQTGPYPLNDAGQVVGTGTMWLNMPGAWIWDAAGGSRALTSLVPAPWRIDEGISINDLGWIVARADNTGYDGNFVLLQPAVPEPATALLIVAALILLAVYSRTVTPPALARARRPGDPSSRASAD